MRTSAPPASRTDLDGFVRLPGVYRRSEIDQLLRPGCDFHIQPERLPPGTQLFTVYQQEAEEAPDVVLARLPEPAPRAASESWLVDESELPDPDPDLPDPSDSPTIARGWPALPSAVDRAWPSHGHELSLGERRARHREAHLCLKCSHHAVCGMAKALDPNLLVTIAACLGFESAAEAPPDGVFAAPFAAID